MTTRSDLSIGDFARRTRLPVSTLRYYDKIGLLVPAVVEPGSGYRRYTCDQLPSATLIAGLRASGVTPKQISQIVAGGAAGSVALAHERHRLLGEIRQRQRALGRLDDLYPIHAPGYTPKLVDRPAVCVAAEEFAAAAADVEDGVLRAVARLRGKMRRVGLAATGPWGATFPLTVQDEIRGFAFAPVSVLGAKNVSVQVRWLTAARSVCVEHHGSGTNLRHAYGAAFAALDQVGVGPGEPVIEEYLAIGATNRGAHGPDAIRIHIPYDRPADQERT